MLARFGNLASGITKSASDSGGEPVKQIFASLSTHPIGDTDGSVPLPLFPNTFAPTASDTISLKTKLRLRSESVR